MGAAVLAVAAFFAVYAFSASGASRPTGYEIFAKFERVDGLKRGADVTLSGIKVGVVTSQELDPKTFQAVVRMSVDSGVKLPLDTVARVTSESLLGGMIVILEPGADDKHLRAGGEIAKTQGAVLLMDLVARAIFGSAGQGGTPGGAKP